MRLLIFSITLITFCFISLTATAQDELEYRSETSVDLNNTLVLGMSPTSSSHMQNVTRGIDGSPYFYDEWTTGIALLPKNLKTIGVQMKFSTFNNRVYFKKEDKTLALDNRRVEGFVLNIDDGWVLFKNGYRYDSDKIGRDTFLRVVHDGTTKILVHHRTYTRKSHKPAIATGRISHEFRHSDDYFLQTEDGKIHEVKNKQKHILRKLNK